MIMRMKNGEHDDERDDDDDDDDLYIIGAVCLSVCQQKSLFLYSKDLGASHVYRHLSLLKSVWKPKKRPNPLKNNFFQGIWSFLMFIDTFPFSKVSGNRRNNQIP